MFPTFIPNRRFDGALTEIVRNNVNKTPGDAFSTRPQTGLVDRSASVSVDSAFFYCTDRMGAMHAVLEPLVVLHD